MIYFLSSGVQYLLCKTLVFEDTGILNEFEEAFLVLEDEVKKRKRDVASHQLLTCFVQNGEESNQIDVARLVQKTLTLFLAAGCNVICRCRGLHLYNM